MLKNEGSQRFNVKRNLSIAVIMCLICGMMIAISYSNESSATNQVKQLEVEEKGFVTKLSSDFNQNTIYLKTTKQVIIFRINKDTEIVDLNGKSLSLDSIKINDSICVYYNGVLSRSYPSLGIAQKIIVMKKVSKQFEKKGFVTKLSSDFNQNTIYLKTTKQVIIFRINKDTEIVDLNGNSLLLDSIKINDSICVYYNGILSRSYPSRGTAQKIIVMKKI